MGNGSKLGKYEIIEEIGKGGFATVYRALDTTLEREVALKVLDPLLMRDPVWVARFRREARAVAKLTHPHVVTIYEVGEAEGMLYIATPLIEGGNLASRIERLGRVPWDEAVRLVDQVAQALDYAHSQGVVHRDLKAANVLLDEERGALITDFGFARVVAESSFSMSISGGIVGTPHYIAPEVWEGQTASPQTDVYALGCILYEMVLGEHLFQGDTTPAVMRAHFKPLELPEAWPEDVPPGFGAVLQRALAKESAARYARAGDLVEALVALEADHLAEPYAALEVAVAAEDWDQALALAGKIRAADADYRDVATLEEKAKLGKAILLKAQAERARKQAAEEAEARERAVRLALFKQLRAQEEAGDWANALHSVRQIEAMDPRNALIIERRQRIEARLREAQSRRARPIQPPPVQPRPRRRLPTWIWLVGGLLAIGILAVVAILAVRLFTGPGVEPRVTLVVTSPPLPTATATLAPTPVPYVEMDTYTIDEWGLTVSWPTTWEMDDSGYEVTFYEEEGAFFQMQAGSFEEMGFTTPEEGWNLFYTESATTTLVSEPESYTVDGAYAVRGTLEDYEWDIRAWVVTVTANDYAYLFLAVASPLEGWRDAEPIFEAMLNSIDLFPPYVEYVAMQTYTNDYGAYSVDYPSSWYVEDLENGDRGYGEVSIATSPGLNVNEQEGAQFWMVGGLTGDMGFYTAEDGWNLLLSNLAPSSMASYPEYYAVDGITGLWGTIDDYELGFNAWAIVVVAGDYGYYIWTLTNQSSDWFEYEPIFEDMLNSIQLNSP